MPKRYPKAARPDIQIQWDSIRAKGRTTDQSEEWDWGAIRVGRLARAETPEDYEIHLAALEWGLDPTILINKAEDIQARKHWQDLLKPFEHQVKNLITFCRRAPVALIADDVGLGKTISAGLILSELITRGKVGRALVLAPKILGPQWKEELRTKFRISSEVAAGQELDHLVANSSENVITTYHSARNRIPVIESAGFDMLILDEAHHLRNLYGTQKPPMIAEALQRALKNRAFRYVLMLTATPIHNRLWDIYSLIELLTTAKGHTNPLGSERAFAQRYIEDGKSSARVLVPGRQDEFRQHLSNYLVRTRRADCGLSFPDRRVLLERAHPVHGELELFEVMDVVFEGLNALTQISLAQALMSSPEAFLKQLRNMHLRTGSVDIEDLDYAEEIASSIGTTGKLKKLLSLLSQLKHEKPNDWRAVIFTGRKETQQKIGEFLQRNLKGNCVGFIQGGQARSNQKSIENYNANPPIVNVIISTDAGAEGVNLQAGNVVVNYDLPWNPMIVEQRIGRVQRLGSNHAKVLVLNLVLAGSVEERIVGRLAQKLAAIAQTIGDLEGVLEGLDSSNDSAESFQRRILTLVRDTLAGRNVEKALAMQEASIERAQKIYEEEKENVDKRLGRLDAMHEDGPRMPELQEIQPRLTEREFATKALLAEGNPLMEVDEDLFVHQIPGHAPEQVYFSREAFDNRRQTGFAGGPRANLYLSGQPAFEQLVGKWSGESAHCIRDMRAIDEGAVEQAVESWAETFGPHLELLECKLASGKELLSGNLVTRAATSVAHDKYEKIICTPYSSIPLEIKPEVNSDAPIGAKDFYPDEFEDSIRECIVAGTKADPDIQKFNSFYLQRLKEEQRKASNRELRRLAKISFTPNVSLNLVGIDGQRHQLLNFQVIYNIAGNGEFESRLSILAHNGQIAKKPDTGLCDISKVSAPVDALERCSITSAYVVKNFLLTSQLSGKHALQEHCIQCEQSGRVLLRMETEECHATGKRVGKDLLKPSDLSGKLALKNELMKCRFTESRILPSEAKRSDISNKVYRSDQGATCPATNSAGHRSEFTRCVSSGHLCAPSAIGFSDISRQPCRLDLLVGSSKNPQRKGLPSEVVTCSISGKTLLRDEVETSAISGSMADRSLMQKSAKSGKWALPDELRTCAETGALLLPTEGAECAVSNHFVDLTLLEISAISKKRAHRKHFKASCISGTRALPDELQACEATGQLALPAELEQCIGTGKTVLPSELVTSHDPSGKILRSKAVFSDFSGNTCLSGNETQCQWTGKTVLANELWRCKLSNLKVLKECLDRKGELRGLRRFFEDRSFGTPIATHELDGLDLSGFAPLKKTSAFRTMDSTPEAVLVLAAQQSRLLGLTSKTLMQIFSKDGEILFSG